MNIISGQKNPLLSEIYLNCRYILSVFVIISAEEICHWEIETWLAFFQTFFVIFNINNLI